jgi:hypothetical protein
MYQQETLKLHTWFPWACLGEIYSLLHDHYMSQGYVNEGCVAAILRKRPVVNLGFVENLNRNNQFATRVSVRDHITFMDDEQPATVSEKVASGTMCFRVGEQQYLGEFTTILRPVDRPTTSKQDALTSRKKAPGKFDPPSLDADSCRWNDYKRMLDEATRFEEQKSTFLIPLPQSALYGWDCGDGNVQDYPWASPERSVVSPAPDHGWPASQQLTAERGQREQRQAARRLRRWSKKVTHLFKRKLELTADPAPAIQPKRVQVPDGKKPAEQWRYRDSIKSFFSSSSSSSSGAAQGEVSDFVDQLVEEVVLDATPTSGRRILRPSTRRQTEAQQQPQQGENAVTAVSPGSPPASRETECGCHPYVRCENCQGRKW